MTTARWLETRTPEPPAALRARLAEVLDLPRGAGSDRHSGARPTAAGASAEQISDVCLAAAERTLAALLREDCATRAAALDLLAADALATYAFEAAAGTPGALPERAAAALRRIAQIGATSRERHGP